MKITITILIPVIFTLCDAQTTNQPASESWGVINGNAQLSVGFSTNAVKAGADITLFVRIRNLSTNVLELNPLFLGPHLLTNQSERICKLTPVLTVDEALNTPGIVRRIKVNPRGVYEWSQLMKVSDSTLSGDYFLSNITASVFIAKDQARTVASKPLKLNVVNAKLSGSSATSLEDSQNVIVRPPE